MARTKTDMSEQLVWVVEAECSGDRMSWMFGDKEVAEWFRDIAQEYYMARCPTCLTKDVLNLQVNVGVLTEAMVSCGCRDCEFAKRVVRTTTKDGQAIWVPAFRAKEMLLSPMGS